MSRLKKAVPDVARRPMPVEIRKMEKTRVQPKSLGEILKIDGIPKKLGDFQGFVNDMIFSYYVESGIFEVDRKMVKKNVEKFEEGENLLKKLMKNARSDIQTQEMKETVGQIYRSMPKKSKKVYDNLQNINSILTDFSEISVDKNFNNQVNNIMKRLEKLEPANEQKAASKQTTQPLLSKDELKKSMKFLIMAGKDVTTKNSKFVRNVASKILEVLDSGGVSEDMKGANGYVDAALNQRTLNFMRQYHRFIFPILSIIIVYVLYWNVDAKPRADDADATLRYTGGTGPTIARENINRVRDSQASSYTGDDKTLSQIIFPLKVSDKTLGFTMMDEGDGGFGFENLDARDFVGLEINELARINAIDGTFRNQNLIKDIGRVTWKAVNMRIMNSWRDVLISFGLFFLAKAGVSSLQRRRVAGLLGGAGVQIIGPIINFWSERKMFDVFSRGVYSNVSPQSNVANTFNTLIRNRYFPLNLENVQFGLNLNNVTFFTPEICVAASMLASEAVATVADRSPDINSRLRYELGEEEDAKLEIYPENTKKVLTISTDKKFVQSEDLRDTEKTQWMIGSPFTCVRMFNNLLKPTARGIVLPTDDNFDSQMLSFKDVVCGIEKDVAIMKRSGIEIMRSPIINTEYDSSMIMSDVVTLGSLFYSLYNYNRSPLVAVSVIRPMLYLLRKEFMLLQTSYCAELKFDNIGNGTNGLMVGRLNSRSVNNTTFNASRRLLTWGDTLRANDTESLKSMLGMEDYSNTAGVFPYLKRVRLKPFVGNGKRRLFRGDFVEYSGGDLFATKVIEDILKLNNRQQGASAALSAYDLIGSFYEIKENDNGQATIEVQPLDIQNNSKRSIFVFQNLMEKDKEADRFRWRYVNEWKYENGVCSFDVGSLITDINENNANQRGVRTSNRRGRTKSPGRRNNMVQLENLTI